MTNDRHHLARMAARHIHNPEASVRSLAEFEAKHGGITGHATSKPELRKELREGSSGADAEQKRSFPESRMKRLQRAYQALDETERLAIGAYQVLDQERHRALREVRGGNVVGPFSERDREDPHFREADARALARVAGLMNLSEDEVLALTKQGLEILKTWFPNDYAPWRI